MIAEIHHKISASGSNWTERLEDGLTGNFFGALRYVPFQIGLGRILKETIYPSELATIIQQINETFWEDHIKFWPYDREGEIDVLMDFSETTIGIEVKFMSGLSSNDDVDNQKSNECEDDERIEEESRQQLARESRILSRKSPDKSKLLILVADEADYMSVYNDTINRKILDENVMLGAISWQDILLSIKYIHTDNEYWNLVLWDLCRLLISKGFERFSGFECDSMITINGASFYSFQNEEFTFTNYIWVEEGLTYEFG